MSSKASAKFVEEIGKLSVIELAELIKELEQTFGVSAAAPVMAAAPAAAEAAPAAAAKSEFKVVLKDAGAEKVKVIRALRQIKKDMGVTEARTMVDETPSVVHEAAPKDEAENMKKLLEEAGAKVELQ
jgi:large subunit ribosomal protein L7/L12